VVFVVVTVFEPLGLDTLTLDELLALLAAPAPLVLVPLELVDARDEPLDVDVLELDLDALELDLDALELDLDALAPARAAVLPLVTIMFHRQNLLKHLYAVRLIKFAFHEFFV